MIYYGFLLFIVLEYVRPATFVPGLNSLHLNSVVPIAVIVGSFIASGPVSRTTVAKETNTKVILFFLGLIVMSVLTADVTFYAFEVFKTILGYVFIYWVIATQITTDRRLKGVFLTLVFVHVALAALTPQMFTDPDARHYLSSGTFLGDGNDYALSVNVAIPFCLFLMYDASTKRHKLLYGGFLLLLVLCVVATKSRGGTIALGCVGVYYWLKSHRKLLTASLAAVVLAIVLVYAPPSYFERMGTISSYQDGSSQGRLTAWTAGMHMALDHPLLGVGAGHFPVKFGVEYRPAGAHMPWLTAHSIYFLILGELGLPGIGALIFFFGSNFVANRRLIVRLTKQASPESRRHAQLLAALSASLLGYAIAGAFLSAAYYPHMFVVAGLLVSGRRLARAGLAEVLAKAPAAAPALTCHPAMRRAPVASRGISPL
jgi:putative inorganic carbon (HCO3(-)) transporter